MKPTKLGSVLTAAALTTLLGSMLAPPSAASETLSEHPPAPALDAGLNSFGANQLGDEVVAGGPGWRAVFRTGEFEFTPALGADAHVDSSVRFQLGEISRAGHIALPTSDATRPSLTANRVEYRHGGVIERYDVRRGGVEQSFVLQTRPGGSGDLVVRLDFETHADDIEAAPDGRSARFEFTGRGGLSIGAVTTIDANDARHGGKLRVAGGSLEIVVPEDVVDNAAYPLVIDPFYAPDLELTILESGHHPDVAFDPVTNQFLVVWEALITGPAVDIRGQRVNPDGTLSGGLLIIDYDPAFTGSFVLPAVANDGQAGEFLVIYARREGQFGEVRRQILGRGVSASTGAVSPFALSFTNSQSTEQVGEPHVGDAGSDGRFLVVWENEVSESIRGVVSFLDGNLTPFKFTNEFEISSGSSGHSRVDVAGGRGSNHWCVVWERFFASPAPGDFDLSARVVNSSGSFGTSQLGYGEIGDDEFIPEVAGSGQDFMVVFGDDSESGFLDDDLSIVPLTYSGSSLQWGARQTVDENTDEEFLPAIAYTGGSFVVTWIVDDFLDPPRGVVRVADAVTGEFCTSPEGLGTVWGTGPLEVATRYTGDQSDEDQVLLAVEVDKNTGSTDIEARFYDPPTGIVTDLGGGCAGASQATVTCATSGNDGFEHRLDAFGFSTWFLLIATDRLDFPCGSCVIVPDFTAALAFPVTADNSGLVSLTMPIPSGLAGLRLYEQWVVPTAFPNCPTFGVNASNALEVIVQ